MKIGILFLSLVVLGSSTVLADTCICRNGVFNPERVLTTVNEQVCRLQCMSECRQTGEPIECLCAVPNNGYEFTVVDPDTSTCTCKSCTGDNICEDNVAQAGECRVQTEDGNCPSDSENPKQLHLANLDLGCKINSGGKKQICCGTTIDDPKDSPEFTTVGVCLAVVIAGGASYWLLKRKK